MTINNLCLFIFFIFNLKFSSQIDDDYNILPGTNDQLSNICSKRGIYTNKQCICINGYITLYKQNRFQILNYNDEDQCAYKLKSKKIALILSIFGGVLGSDQFYLGHNVKGFLKVITPVFMFFILVYLKLRIKSKMNIYIILVLPLLCIILFWIIDIALIICGYTTDGYGYKLI